MIKLEERHRLATDFMLLKGKFDQNSALAEICITYHFLLNKLALH